MGAAITPGAVLSLDDGDPWVVLARGPSVVGPVLAVERTGGGPLALVRESDLPAAEVLAHGAPEGGAELLPRYGSNLDGDPVCICRSGGWLVVHLGRMQ